MIDPLDKKVLDAAPKRLRSEYVILYNAVVSTIKSYNGNPTAINKKNWDTASAALAEKEAEILGQSKKKSSARPQPEFKSKAAVYRWLLDNNRQISETQFYDHCAEGLLRKKRGSKVFTQAAVKKYAKLHTKSAETGEKERDRLDKIQDELKEIELEKEQLKLEELRHKQRVKQGKVMPIEEHENAIVGRQVAAMAQLSHMAQKNVKTWIALVNGDQTKAPALLEAMLEEIAQRMSVFAADIEFDIILEADA
ncbi:MAG: hypothetical protein OEY01_14425 [Desulfobulbaceae bacterium]|nr:hypothetical protein [Desulfobulbaceae bacterium]